MGLWSRILLLFKIKSNAALDRVEDPRQTMEYAYGQQLQLLQNVRRGLIEVATSRRQLEQQSQQLRSQVPQMESQARRALAANREDLARISLRRKQMALGELEGLDRQVAEVGDEEHKLTLAEQQLSTRIEEFRTRRDVVSARYNAAEAEVRVKEALAGVAGEFAELSMAVGRAEEKTDRLRARASAIDALLEVGSLTMPGGSDRVEQELRTMTADKAVEEELAGLKAELGRAGESPQRS
jgi:phage shock protein A